MVGFEFCLVHLVSCDWLGGTAQIRFMTITENPLYLSYPQKEIPPLEQITRSLPRGRTC